MERVLHSNALVSFACQICLFLTKSLVSSHQVHSGLGHSDQSKRPREVGSVVSVRGKNNDGKIIRDIKNGDIASPSPSFPPRILSPRIRLRFLDWLVWGVKQAKKYITCFWRGEVMMIKGPVGMNAERIGSRREAPKKRPRTRTVAAAAMSFVSLHHEPGLFFGWLDFVFAMGSSIDSVHQIDLLGRQST